MSVLQRWIPPEQIKPCGDAVEKIRQLGNTSIEQGLQVDLPGVNNGNDTQMPCGSLPALSSWLL